MAAITTHFPAGGRSTRKRNARRDPHGTPGDPRGTPDTPPGGTPWARTYFSIPRFS